MIATAMKRATTTVSVADTRQCPTVTTLIIWLRAIYIILTATTVTIMARSKSFQRLSTKRQSGGRKTTTNGS
jgi:hypothetical protein